MHSCASPCHACHLLYPCTHIHAHTHSQSTSTHPSRVTTTQTPSACTEHLCNMQRTHTLMDTREHVRPMEHMQSCMCMHTAHMHTTHACAQVYVNMHGARGHTEHTRMHSIPPHMGNTQACSIRHITPASRLPSLAHHLPAWGGIPSVLPSAPTMQDWGQLSGALVPTTPSPWPPRYSRRVRVPLCQDSLSFLDPGRGEEFGKQTQPGKGWVAPRGQPEGRRVPGGHDGSDTALSNPACSPC